MKIAVTATGSSMDAPVEARFGRAPYYIIVDTDTMAHEAIENPNVSAGGGAGIQSAQLIAERDVKFVLTGNCGPNAFNVFGAAGVQIIVGVTGTVIQAVEQFKSGAFAATNQPNVASHFGMGGGMGGGRGMGQGMGGGRGMGMGRGMGQGMGGGRGMGMGMGGGRGMAPAGGYGYQAQQGNLSKEEELAALKEQARVLQEQLKNIQEQIDKSDKQK
jgi:predicted Fe-Mo cluster-binding NifX family protein